MTWLVAHACYTAPMSLAEIPQLAKLSTEEKLQLVEDLWDSIAALPQDLPVSEAEQKLLEERWAAHRQNPATALTLEEFKQQLAQRL